MSDSSYGSVYVEGVTYIDEREIAKRDAEIERLREGERAADAEIERLREAVKFLNSFRPDAELAKRDAEIDRLREQVAVWLECYKTEKQKREDLEKRIRELIR